MQMRLKSETEKGVKVVKYGLNPRFAFANGYFWIFPAGLHERFYEGEGECVPVGNYVICFKKRHTGRNPQQAYK